MNEKPRDIKGLKFIKNLSWEQVFDIWQKHEGSMPEWHAVANKKGWDTWEAWRETWLGRIGAKDRAWHIYEISDPLVSVPDFKVGPTQTWQNHFSKDEANQHSFGELVDKVSYADNPKIKGLLANYPKATQFIGVVMPNGDVHVIEGHHRVTTIAYAARENIPLTFNGLPTIALAFFKDEDKQLLDKMLKRGTTKNPPPQ